MTDDGEGRKRWPRRRPRKEPPPPRKRCGDTPKPDGTFVLSRITGEPCQAWALDHATRCKYHGGVQQRAAFDNPYGRDRELSGRKPTVGIYSKYLREEFVDDYAEALESLGTIDGEIATLRAYLAWAIRRQQEKPDGGVVVSAGPAGTKVRLFADVVAELADRIRLAERSRADLEAQKPPTDDDLLGYQQWQALNVTPAPVLEDVAPPAPSLDSPPLLSSPSSPGSPPEPE